jgi:hypothetical protein
LRVVFSSVVVGFPPSVLLCVVLPGPALSGA